ncbi:MAG: pyruvate, phosphate dikinase, partial [Acidobacteriaceae bacterium]|nr:pyruvate, phosphate dikinase [Acidobacteriaceae bacterium]
MSDVKRIYSFGMGLDGVNNTEGDRSMNYILGGKGANLAEMARMDLPVPPGFTITCQTCNEYSSAVPMAFPAGLAEDVAQHTAELERKVGKNFGDVNDPLLVSVRSGAAFSMPGMMDTVLNLGLNDESIKGVIAQTGNERFAWDSYRRFIQMFSGVVMEVDGDLFENAITMKKHERGVAADTELTADDLRELVGEFKEIFSNNVS